MVGGSGGGHDYLIPIYGRTKRTTNKAHYTPDKKKLTKKFCANTKINCQ